MNEYITIDGDDLIRTCLTRNDQVVYCMKIFVLYNYVSYKIGPAPNIMVHEDIIKRALNEVNVSIEQYINGTD